MLKPPSVKPLGNSKEVAQLLRPVPTLKQIPGLLKEEARDQFLHGPKNSMKYYFIPQDKNSPEKKSGNPVEKSFKSIHGVSETREKQRIIEKLADPKYNFIEKQALKDVRKKQGKLFLLNDIYTEITKEVAEKSKTDVRPSKNKQIRFHLEEEEKMVEELERWEKLTSKNKSKVMRDSENKNDMSDIKQDSKHFILPQIKRPPGIETNVSGVGLEKFMKRNGSQRSSIAIPISLENENFNGLELPSPIHHVTETLSAVKFEEENGKDEDHDNDHGLIKIVDVMQQDEDLDHVRAQIYKMMEGEDDMDFSGENTKQFSLKNISLLCRGINQDMEDKVNLSLGETRILVKESEDLVKRLEDENGKLSQEVIQLNKQIEKLGYHNRNQDDYAFLEDEPRKLWDEDREMDAHLKNELDEANYKMIENEAARVKAKKEFREYRGKLVNIQTLQKQLYKAILLQGLDTKEEGLLWIVRKLLEIGDPATQKDFPRYLDQKSRKFIIERLKAQNEIKDLNQKERSVIDNFRKSKEHADTTTQLSSALLNTSKNNLENSKVLGTDYRSSIKTGSLRSSAELPRTSVKSAFRIDTLDTSQSPETRKTINDTLGGGGGDSSRERINAGSGSEIHSPATATLPTEENDDYSWQGARSEAKKWSRFTENEEIYKNAKKVIRDIMKNEEEQREMKRPQLRSRTYAPFTLEKQKSILKTPNESIFANNYDTRRDFLLKMQNFHQDLQSKQEKMKEDYEAEIARIVTEHGNPRKNIDLGVYLMAVIGPSETIKYFNKFAIRESRPI